MNQLQKWIQRAIGVKAAPTPSSYTGLPQFKVVEGTLVTVADNRLNYIEKGYDINDIVYSIVNLILDKVRVAPWGLYKVVDESSLKSYHAITAKKGISPEDYRLARDFRKKAIEPVENPGKIGELLKYANDYDSFNDLVANDSGYLLLTGNSFIWGNRLEAGVNTGLPNMLWTLPAQWVDLVITQNFPARVTQYQVNTWQLKFSPEEILHRKKWNPNWDISGQQLYGMSPLKAALGLTNRNNSAMRAATAKFQNGGLDSIVFVDDQRFSGDEAVEQAQALKQKLISPEYRGPDARGKIAASGYKVGKVDLGLSPVELAIIEAEKWDMRRFCNIFGVPSQLMNDPENKTFNNQKEAEKALTNRCALPLLTSFRDNFNRKLQADWGGTPGTIVDFDMTVFTELQQDVGEMMEWIAKLPYLPPNRALELLNIETIDDPMFDEPWITQGMGQPLSEWQMNDVDNTLNNDQSGDTEDDL